MKICLIHSLYPPFNRSGAEKVVIFSAQGFLKQGHEVVVITLGRENKVENIDGVRVYRLKSINLFSFIDINSQPAWLRLPWHLIDMFNFLSAKQVKQILAAEKPDLVIAHNLKGLGYLIPRVIKNLGLRYIQVVHDVQLSVPTGLLIVGQEKFEKNILCRIYSAINRQLFNFPDVVISPSQWLLNFYLARGFFTKSEKKVLLNPSPEVFVSIGVGKFFNPQKN